MIKEAYFDVFDGPGWPSPDEIEHYFLAPKGQEWSYRGGNDSWGLDIEGLHGSDNLPDLQRINVHLYMVGNPDHGVHLYYKRWDGRIQRHFGFVSKGDMARLREYVRTMHGTPLPVGLFIPFATAWPAVREFIETDGELPKSIAWIDDRDLPPDTFPDP